MLQAIRQEGFEPDKTRSGTITPSKLPVHTPGTRQSLLVASGVVSFHSLDSATNPANFSSDSKKVDVFSQSGGAEASEVLKVNSDSLADEGGDQLQSPAPSIHSGNHQDPDGDQSPDLLSETSEEASQQTTTSSGEEEAEQPPPQPQPMPFYGADFELMSIHCCQTATTFKCGRKLTTA